VNPALRPWRLLGAAVGTGVAATLAVRFVAARVPGAAGAVGAAGLEAGFTLLLAAALAGIALVALRRMGASGDLAGLRPAGAAALGGGVGLACLLAAIVDAGLAGVAHPVPGTSASPLILMGAVAVGGLAAAEELFFRGWLQPGLARDWGRTPALLVAAAAFASLHLLGGGRAPLSLLNLLLGGLLFGLLRDRMGGLAAPVAAHVAYNLAEQLALGLDPNPGLGSYGSLWNLDLAGQPLWGGSAEGLNGSLGLTLALLAAILPLGTGFLAASRSLSRQPNNSLCEPRRARRSVTSSGLP